MSKWKQRWVVGMLGLYAVLIAGAAGHEFLHMAHGEGWFSGLSEPTLRASGGEGGGDSWQAFLPGMLK